MRYVFGTLIISSLFVFLLSSCQEKTYCFDCTTSRYYVTMPEKDTVRLDSEVKVHCNHTNESIKEVENNGTHYVEYHKDGKLVTEYTNTKCRP